MSAAVAARHNGRKKFTRTLRRRVSAFELKEQHHVTTSFLGRNIFHFHLYRQQRADDVEGVQNQGFTFLQQAEHRSRQRGQPGLLDLCAQFARRPYLPAALLLHRHQPGHVRVVDPTQLPRNSPAVLVCPVGECGHF
jgi:hypothetical protein